MLILDMLVLVLVLLLLCLSGGVLTQAHLKV